MPDNDFQDDLIQAIAQITAAVTNTSLYSPTHPQVGQYVEKAYGTLASLLAGRPEITVMLIGDDLVAGNTPLPSTGAYVMNFIRVMKKKGVERITFMPGMPREELQALVLDLADPDAMAIRSRPFIKLGKVELRVRRADEQPAPRAAGVASGQDTSPVPDVPPEALQELMALTATELDELKDIYLRIKKHKQINVGGIDEIVKGFVKEFRREINPLGLMAAIKSSHEYTFTHVTNVGILTMSSAEALGFSGEHLHQIGVASLLHDVGKLFIPEEILSKPGKLSTEERQIIETHTTKGARYLMGLEGIPKLAVLAALEHHLKFDGTGYPSIKGGWQPNITSQLIAIADVFDAMRSRRSYQEPQPLEKVEEVLRKGSGTQFNPKLVEHFLRMIRRK